MTEDLISRMCAQQTVAQLLHVAHRNELHCLHKNTSVARVASFVMSGAHWQPLTAIVQPSQLLYLRHFAPPSRATVNFLLNALATTVIDDTLFARDVGKCCGLILRELNIEPAQKWIKETMLLSPSESYRENLDSLLLHLVDCPEDLSHLLYHLCLRTLRAVPFASPKYTQNVYPKIRPALMLFAEECSFAITGDNYLHSIIHAHLPAEIAMAEPTPFRHITSVMGDCANKHIRPYINISAADQMQARSEDADDVVLFCLIVTLIVEIEKKKELQLRFNRNVLGALNPTCPPSPFVLVDLDCGHGRNDYYGYTFKGSLVVCNGLGCAQAVSQWISVCKDLTYSREVIDGRPSPGNPLYKFNTAV